MFDSRNVLFPKNNILKYKNETILHCTFKYRDEIEWTTIATPLKNNIQQHYISNTDLLTILNYRDVIYVGISNIKFKPEYVSFLLNKEKYLYYRVYDCRKKIIKNNYNYNDNNFYEKINLLTKKEKLLYIFLKKFSDIITPPLMYQLTPEQILSLIYTNDEDKISCYFTPVNDKQVTLRINLYSLYSNNNKFFPDDSTRFIDNFRRIEHPAWVM